jgi:hypothetical protein
MKYVNTFEALTKYRYGGYGAGYATYASAIENLGVSPSNRCDRHDILRCALTVPVDRLGAGRAGVRCAPEGEDRLLPPSIRDRGDRA